MEKGPTVSRLYRTPGVDWLVAGQEQFSSATTLRYVDLNGLPQDNTLGPLNTRSLTDVRRRARELTPPARKGKFLADNKPNNKHHKLYRPRTGNQSRTIRPLVEEISGKGGFGGEVVESSTLPCHEFE